MIIIGKNGLEFNATIEENTVSNISTTKEIEINNKRFCIHIEFNDENVIETNEEYSLIIKNDKISKNDIILTNINSFDGDIVYDKVFIFATNIIDGKCTICIVNKGDTIRRKITCIGIIMT